MTIMAGLALTGNSTNLTKQVLENQREYGSSKTVGTLVDNSEGNLSIWSHPSLSSCPYPPKDLINPRGHPDTTVVVTGMLEEENPMCFQCGRKHFVNTNKSLMGLFVTENPQLYHSCVAHGGNPDSITMGGTLIKSNINMNSLIHIKPVLLNSGLLAGKGLFTNYVSQKWGGPDQTMNSTNKQLKLL